MKKQLKIFTLLAVGLLGLAQFAIADEFTDKYNSITDRNIFLKERQRPRPPTSRNSDRPRNVTVEEPAESRIVLRGVVIEDEELRAYFENTRGNTITKVVPGESIGKGHVMEIAIDAVQIELDGKSGWIEIGHNLLGNRVASTSSPSYSRPSIPAPRTPAAPGVTTPPGTMQGMSVPGAGTITPNTPMTGENQNQEATTEEGGDHVEAATPPAATVDPSSLSIEERLKLRRQAERSGAR